MTVRRLIWWCALCLCVGAGACYNKKDYTLTEPHVAAILSLRSVNGATTIPADGVSQLALVASISANADPDKRDILFTTTAGALVGGTPDAASGGRVVTAASNGQAGIELQSAPQIQPAVVTAAVKNVAGVVATLAIQFVAVGGNAIVRFVSAPVTAPADGATLTAFTVAVSPQVMNQKVTFTASLGSFIDSPASVDTNNTATGHLMSPGTIGSADVTASIDGFTRDTAVQFLRALPNRITVGVNNPVLAAGDTANAVVTAQMLRDVGHVTPGAVATFSAADAGGNSVGFFTSAQQSTTDATGTVTTQFFPGATALPGQVTITVTTPGDGGITIKSSVVVEIVAGS